MSSGEQLALNKQSINHLADRQKELERRLEGFIRDSKEQRREVYKRWDHCQSAIHENTVQIEVINASSRVTRLVIYGVASAVIAGLILDIVDRWMV